MCAACASGSAGTRCGGTPSAARGTAFSAPARRGTSLDGIDVLAVRDSGGGRRLGYLPQEFGVYPKVTAYELLDQPQGAEHARGHPGGSGDLAVLDVALAAHPVHLRAAALQALEPRPVGGGPVAVEQARGVSKTVMDSAQQIWLAGLGALLVPLVADRGAGQCSSYHYSGSCRGRSGRQRRRHHDRRSLRSRKDGHGPALHPRWHRARRHGARGRDRRA